MAEQANSTGRRRRRWPFFVFLALAAVSLLLHATKVLRDKEISGRQKQYAELVRTRPVAATKARRARFYQIRYFLGYPMAVSYAAADLVRRVGAIAAPLRLLSVQIDPGLQDMGFELTVELAGVRPRELRRRLTFFLERLRRVPNIVSADFSGPGPTSRGGGVRVFTVSGRAEIQP